jgi:POLQ-like helicase
MRYMKGQQMKPEFNSHRLFGITRSKGKMYEFGLPEALHLEVPEKSEPQELFLLAVGTLGDVSDKLSETDNVNEPLPESATKELLFSASFFDAFIESRFNQTIDRDTALLAASAYYLVRRPGSSQVLARQLPRREQDSPVEKLLHWLLLAEWSNYPTIDHPLFGKALGDVARLMAIHFYDGSGVAELTAALKELRRRAYHGASSRELLFIDIVAAVVHMRIAASAWTTMARFSGIPIEQWSTAIRKPSFPKELWPSQMLIGEAGLFSGASGVIQMPTSAGKTRSLEIVIRSGFLAGRTKLAVVVAPYRALCNEIATSLRRAFKTESVKVNELSDAIQFDFVQQLEELLGTQMPTSNNILVLTPEKFLYVLRQTPKLVNHIGIVVYDEGHQFDAGSRGITYELLLTEIKSLLSSEAQTLLVSAVIQNAQAIGTWLMGEGAQVVNGTGLRTTSRAVAFTSWLKGRRGQMMFFESDTYDKRDYYVPSIIEKQLLANRGREYVKKYFPDESTPYDVALYLGIRLVPKGAVAIFCGRKKTASNIASRAVKVFEREFSGTAPATSSDTGELERMVNLVGANFGAQSALTKAAVLGIFVHHGATPHGIRLSIEHGMQKEKLKFVACTSTLAQGVNLPIRYLIVSGIRQTAEKIKVRDFQNLVGRAGRSGMHTEGLIIFSDPQIYDKRKEEPWKFRESVELLSPLQSEAATSSLLGLIGSFWTSDHRGELHLPIDRLCELLFAGEDRWRSWAENIVRVNPRHRLDVDELIEELKRRRRLILVIESYLMANRGANSIEEFKAAAEVLASATLAHYLGTEEQRLAIRILFRTVAEYIHQQAPSTEKQAIYSKTLLDVKKAKIIENWVADNRDVLLSLKTNEDWLSAIWSLFSSLSDDKFFHRVLPEYLPNQLTLQWLQGSAYHALVDYAKSEHGTKPWGTTRSSLTENDIIDFFEGTLGFDCSLMVAAVAQFLFGENNILGEASAPLILFQKSLKYGLPDLQSISCYEYGFTDRVVAQHLCASVRLEGYTDNFFEPAVEMYRDRIEDILKDYPSYFGSVLASRV